MSKAAADLDRLARQFFEEGEKTRENFLASFDAKVRIQLVEKMVHDCLVQDPDDSVPFKDRSARMTAVLKHVPLEDRQAILQNVDKRLEAFDEEQQRGTDVEGVEEPPAMQDVDLDVVLPKMDAVQDLKVVTREFTNAHGGGKFEALHNERLGRSLMSGTFECMGPEGVSTYKGTFLCSASGDADPEKDRPLPHGQGVREHPDGSVYVGQWKDGHPDGDGKWQAGGGHCESYVGEWRAGKRHGHGLQKFANGDTYEGDWANGKFHHRGKYTYANGDQFCGIWEDGMKKDGSFYFLDGRISRRTWERGQLITCQDFDGRKKSYLPTIARSEIHNPERSAYGTKVSTGIISPRGVMI